MRVPKHNLSQVSLFLSDYENLYIFAEARYLREYGIPSIGFSPMIREEILLHDHNERLNEKTFLRGVEIYETVLKNLAEVQI